jgi:hypothetical protein
MTDVLNSAAVVLITSIGHQVGLFEEMADGAPRPANSASFTGPTEGLDRMARSPFCLEKSKKLPAKIAKSKKQAPPPVEKDEGGKGQLPLF